jgi:D-alanyl-D-alanine carboxypeptidase (penicillin-binding protein 5/6)
MKKIFTIILVLMFLPQNAHAAPVSAQSAVLIDADNRRVLFEKNSTSKMGMASTTKIMTAILAIEKCDVNEIAKVSYNASITEGSSMYLKSGEQVSVYELLCGLLLSSGNDAAVALAEHISGSCEEFALLMTERAKQLGAYMTSLENPSGLDGENHYTTAQDLAVITCHAMTLPLFAKLVSSASIKTERAAYFNHNKLLSMYQGITGVKTGFTKACGRCLVSSVSRNGFNMIAVTLNAPDDWNDHMRMYDEAFSKYVQVTPIADGDSAGMAACEGAEQNVPLIYKGSISLYLNAEEQKKLEIINDVPPILSPPITKGQKVGSAYAYIDGAKMAECDILANETIEKKESGFMKIFYDTMIIWLKSYR